MHNSTIDVFFLFLSSYMFRHFAILRQLTTRFLHNTQQYTSASCKFDTHTQEEEDRILLLYMLQAYRNNIGYKIRKSEWQRHLEKLRNPITDLDRPWGFQEVKAPRFQDTRHMKVVIPTHRLPLLPWNIRGTHFCYRLSRSQGHSATGRITSMKNSKDTLENRRGDLQACPRHHETIRQFCGNSVTA
jgi:hypothetical protein